MGIVGILSLSGEASLGISAGFSLLIFKPYFQKVSIHDLHELQQHARSAILSLRDARRTGKVHRGDSKDLHYSWLTKAYRVVGRGQ